MAIRCKQCGKVLKKKKYRRSNRPCGYQWERDESFKKRNFCDRKCLNEWKKGKHFSAKTEFQKGMVPWNKDRPRSDKTKKKLRKISNKYWKEHNNPLKGKQNIKAKGNQYWKLRKNTPKGEEHYNWKGGITKIKKKVYDSSRYKKWRKEILQRDNYTCQACNKRSCYLEVHHIKPRYIIFKENNIKNLRDALNCKELWDKDNAITLCRKCHNLTKNGKP